MGHDVIPFFQHEIGDALQLLDGVIGELNVYGKTRRQTGIRLQKIVHLLRVARENEDELIFIVFHSFEHGTGYTKNTSSRFPDAVFNPQAVAGVEGNPFDGKLEQLAARGCVRRGPRESRCRPGGAWSAGGSGAEPLEQGLRHLLPHPRLHRRCAPVAPAWRRHSACG
ncbi:hypothetical protein, partial [Gorillibacterium massiliense]|uniref:hypothetical protein n=1 Tax=Gorillibacterium massiliense TaxID=1280390 RepID=UPI00307B3544